MNGNTKRGSLFFHRRISAYDIVLYYKYGLRKINPKNIKSATQYLFGLHNHAGVHHIALKYKQW